MLKNRLETACASQGNPGSAPKCPLFHKVFGVKYLCFVRWEIPALQLIGQKEHSRLVHIATATATETIQCKLFVQSSRSVHSMVTERNSNSNGIVVKWVVDPFCDDYDNGTNTRTCTFTARNEVGARLCFYRCL